MNANFALILTCLLLGPALRHSRRFPSNEARALGGYVIHISLPALILTRIPQLLAATRWDLDAVIPISMPWFVFLGSALLFGALGKHFQWPRATTGALILTAGLGNTSFVGIPLVEACVGTQGTPTALLIDQLGSYLVLSTLGITCASLYAPGNSKATLDPRRVLRNIFTFPPLLAMLLSVLLWRLNLPLSDTVRVVLEKLSATTIPLALVSVGFQLTVSRGILQREWRALGLGLSYKLLGAPLLCTALYRYGLQSHDFNTHVTLLEAAMAPMFGAAVVAEEFELDSDLTGLMLGVGIPLSLLTVLSWHGLLSA